MKKNKVIITAVSICLLITAANINAYAEEPAEDTSAVVESPDTGSDKGITAAVAGAVISAAAIVLSYRKRRS